jgi:hypothetical protein
MKFFASLLLALFLAAVPGRTESSDAKPDAKKAETTKKDDDGTSAEKAAPENQFDIPVQEGVPVKGLKIPYYSEDGKTLLMTFAAEEAIKVDPEHIEMTNLNIEANSDDGKTFYIDLPKAVFNLETRILKGDSTVHIQRADFEIFGDTGEFNVKTRFAKIFGNSKMIIFTEHLDEQ